MSINENLAGVLGNIVRNRTQVENNLKQVRAALSQLDDESKASISQLLKKFEHPQAIAQFIQAFAQNEGLAKAALEMEAAIAVLQTAVLDPAIVEKAEEWATANAEAANSPLPPAGQSGASDPAAAAGSGQTTPSA